MRSNLPNIPGLEGVCPLEVASGNLFLAKNIADATAQRSMSICNQADKK